MKLSDEQEKVLVDSGDYYFKAREWEKGPAEFPLLDRDTFESGYRAALEHDPVVRGLVEALEFYCQPRTIYEPGNTRPCEIKSDVDYEFYPNHDVALEALDKYREMKGE